MEDRRQLFRHGTYSIERTEEELYLSQGSSLGRRGPLFLGVLPRENHKLEDTRRTSAEAARKEARCQILTMGGRRAQGRSCVCAVGSNMTITMGSPCVMIPLPTLDYAG